MIIFFELGKLGNQLFQYCGLRQYFPKDKFFFFGCDELSKNFESIDACFIPKSEIGSWAQIGFLIFRRIVLVLVAVRVLGRITEEKDSDNFKLAVRRGLLWNIFVPQNVYLQHREVVNQIKRTPYLRTHLTESAANWIRERKIDQKFSTLVFVHIRRSDYLNWPSKEFPAVLSLGWYKRAMKLMQEKFENSVFVIMGDDLYYLRDIFEESDKILISENTPEVDLAIMSICHSGILSPSSFAWWGAFNGRSGQKNNATFFAPKYWGGHRSKKWIPAGFCTDWITYIE